MATETADVVIVGGGIVGLTLAHHLAEAKGGKVVLLERRALGSGTSAISDAMCGQQAELTDTISRLAVRARRIYETFGERVGGDCGFYNAGILRLTDSMATAEAAAAAARVNGSEARAVTIGEALALHPELNAAGRGGAVLFSDTGHVDTYLTLRSYAAAARRRGADLRECTPVTGMDVHAGRVEVVHTPQGTIAPGAVVLACGPWSASVASLAGLRLPIQATRVSVHFHERPPDFSDRVPCLAAEAMMAPWHRRHFRVLHAARDAVVDPDAPKETCPQPVIDRMTERLHFRLPKMARGRFQGACYTCFDDTPDLRPLLGFVPAPPRNLFLDCGWSGRGFKFAVALGAYCARWILEGKTELDLTPWLASRFARDG